MPPPPVCRGHSVPEWLDRQLEQATGEDLRQSVRDRPTPSRAEAEREKRLLQEGREEPSRKELVINSLRDCRAATTSGEAFFVRMKTRGYRVYKRGKGHSVEDLATGKRYRLRTLGVEQEFLLQLDRWEQMTAILKQVDQVEDEQKGQAWKEEHRAGHQVLEVVDAADLQPETRAVWEGPRQKLDQERSRRPPEEPQRENRGDPILKIQQAVTASVFSPKAVLQTAAFVRDSFVTAARARISSIRQKVSALLGLTRNQQRVAAGQGGEGESSMKRARRKGRGIRRRRSIER